MKLKVGSMFAGIGGFDLGFERAGFEVAWCIEWDRNAQAVLRRRFPNAKIFGDIREVHPQVLDRVDVVCGGFPCQDLSVAGKRAGLAGNRSGLFHDAMRLVRELNPAVLILENVPGLLSSNRGLDFATVIREVAEGWTCEEVAWRVLDSQFFGVAQRRRRVFVVAVGHSRIGCAEEILALSESSGGDPPPRGKTREISSSDAAEGSSGYCWWDGGQSSASITTRSHDQSMPDKSNFSAVIVPSAFTGSGFGQFKEGIGTLRANGGDLGGGSESLIAFRKSKRAHSSEDDETLVDDGLANTLNGFDTGDTRTTHAVAHAFYSTDGTHGVNQTPELCPPLKVGSALGISSPPAVAIPIQDGREMTKSQNGLGIGSNGDPSYTIDRTGSQAVALDSQIVATLTARMQGSSGWAPYNETAHLLACRSYSKMIVRRLTPVECERLQGFPDGWTDIGTDKPTADSHRYKQLGNAVTVNVAEWIARRTRKVLERETE